MAMNYKFKFNGDYLEVVTYDIIYIIQMCHHVTNGWSINRVKYNIKSKTHIHKCYILNIL